MAVTALSLAAVVGAAVFGASADRLANTPRLYGGDWDLTIDLNRSDVNVDGADGMDKHDVLVHLTEGLPATIAYGGEGEVSSGVGRPRPSCSSRVAPTPRSSPDGRPKDPARWCWGRRSPTGSASAWATWWTSRAPRGTVAARIAGLAVFPRFSSYPGAEHTGLGEGVVLPEPLGEQTVVRADDDHVAGDAFALIRLDPGADEAEVRAEIARRAQRDFGLDKTAATALVTLPARPDGLLGYTDLGVIPFLLAGALAVVAGGATLHAIVTSVRRRRRELALLKVLGFRRRQVSGTVAWQASTLAVQAALIGVPLGLVVGRIGWRRFAGTIGVVPTPSVPSWIVLTAGRVGRDRQHDGLPPGPPGGRAGAGGGPARRVTAGPPVSGCGGRCA